MKASRLIFIFLFLPALLPAQKLPLIIQGSAPRFYLDHEVGPKENYYSLGRLYNCSPSQDIAPFNKLDMKEGLKIGQEIMIPLQEKNFSQDAAVSAGEVLVPVFCKIGKGESLGMVASRFKVSQKSLKAWNGLSSDQVQSGKNLIVGYLKVNKENSTLSTVSVKVTDAPIELEEVKKNNIPVDESPRAREPEVRIKEPVRAEPEKKEVPKDQGRDIPSKLSGGYFRSQYDKQMKGKSAENQEGMAGIFKSSSGWDDGKYYCLYNAAQSGNIIRITNPSNQRVVYAKVLDAIPDMKQNEDIILRLSNAAAAELGVTDGKFQCEIKY